MGIRPRARHGPSYRGLSDVLQHKQAVQLWHDGRARTQYCVDSQTRRATARLRFAIRKRACCHIESVLCAQFCAAHAVLARHQGAPSPTSQSITPLASACRVFASPNGCGWSSHAHELQSQRTAKRFGSLGCARFWHCRPLGLEHRTDPSTFSSPFERFPAAVSVQATIIDAHSAV